MTTSVSLCQSRLQKHVPHLSNEELLVKNFTSFIIERILNNDPSSSIYLFDRIIHLLQPILSSNNEPNTRVLAELSIKSIKQQKKAIPLPSNQANNRCRHSKVNLAASHLLNYIQSLATEESLAPLNKNQTKDPETAFNMLQRQAEVSATRTFTKEIICYCPHTLPAFDTFVQKLQSLTNQEVDLRVKALIQASCTEVVREREGISSNNQHTGLPIEKAAECIKTYVLKILDPKLDPDIKAGLVIQPKQAATQLLPAEKGAILTN